MVLKGVLLEDVLLEGIFKGVSYRVNFYMVWLEGALFDNVISEGSCGGGRGWWLWLW